MKKYLKLIRNPTRLNPKGFTMIEALMGILIAGIVFAASAPVIMLAVGTRVQTHRAQQAMEIAQGEISRIQVLMAQGVPQNKEVGKIPPPVASNVKLNQVVAPTSTVTSRESVTDFKQALEVEIDGNKYLIQAFRDPGMRFDQGTAINQLAVFQVGVRVYSIMAKDKLQNLQTNPISLNMTQDFGQQRLRPLAVVYTEVSRSDLQFSLQRYQQYLINLQNQNQNQG